MIEKLQEARRLIIEAMRMLDVRAEECECCGHKRYANWNHKNDHDSLTGALTRVEKVIAHRTRRRELNRQAQDAVAYSKRKQGQEDGS